MGHISPTPAVAQSGLIVQETLTPGSPELISAYLASRTFSTPTKGYCSPLELSPTEVPATREFVRGGRSGFLMATSDLGALTKALGRLINDALCLRNIYAERAEELVRSDFDGRVKADRLCDLIVDLAKPTAGTS